jgi:hypothetical protein
MKLTSQIILPFILVLLLGTASCQNVLRTDQTLQLANTTENKVQVTITLSNPESGQAMLSATFTPQSPSLHLYSKEIPRNGVEGLGRPTLLEIPKGSALKANGKLIESVASQPPPFEPKELLVYPAGPVTLSQPVLLPDGNNWVSDVVLVTYMACDEQGCRAPVQQKPIIVKIPGKGLFQS